jgi:hypothetical protein
MKSRERRKRKRREREKKEGEMGENVVFSATAFPGDGIAQKSKNLPDPNNTPGCLEVQEPAIY